MPKQFMIDVGLKSKRQTR